MLLIRKFAALCHTTVLTLRHYDKVGVLKPYHIDKKSNYRYYLKEQAIDFFKIKQLQNADFSLEEIKIIKDKSDDEIINELDCKMSELEERINLIKELKETYLNEKMKLETELEGIVFERLKAVSGVNRLILMTQQDQVKLKCNKESETIADLINEMQAQIMIGVDSLQDFKPYINAEWSYTKIYSGWEDTGELLAQFEPIPEDYQFAIHLFNINDKMSLYDIDEIIKASNSDDMKDRILLFNVSLSLDERNTYAILYTV